MTVIRRWTVRCLALAMSLTPALAADPLPIRVVVVTMYQQGGDTDIGVGEMHRWTEGLPAPVELAFPISDQPLRYNPDKQVLVVNTGIGTARAAGTIMALGLDPRFDLSRTYWLVAGVAGANPDTAPLASAVWASWVVDGDLAYEIDARQIPSAWSTGYLPIFASKPYQEPKPTLELDNVYQLNGKLVDWAYDLTRDIELPDPPGLAAWRAKFSDHPAAHSAPTVMKGDTLAASTFWHGVLMNDWATDWVAYWTDRAGTFATSSMEDTGTLSALNALARAGRVDDDRVLVLRTTSNFTIGADGSNPAESLANQGADFSALVPAFEAAFAVGSVVVEALVEDWHAHADAIPGGS